MFEIFFEVVEDGEGVCVFFWGESIWFLLDFYSFCDFRKVKKFWFTSLLYVGVESVCRIV